MVYGAIHASATNAVPSDQTNPPAASHPEAPEQSNLSSFFRPTQRSPPTTPGHFGEFFFSRFPKKKVRKKFASYQRSAAGSPSPPLS